MVTHGIIPRYYSSKIGLRSQSDHSYTSRMVAEQHAHINAVQDANCTSSAYPLEEDANERRHVHVWHIVVKVFCVFTSTIADVAVTPVTVGVTGPMLLFAVGREPLITVSRYVSTISRSSMACVLLLGHIVQLATVITVDTGMVSFVLWKFAFRLSTVL